jgi:tetratricopeptide (TPR) repeat protein
VVNFRTVLCLVAAGTAHAQTEPPRAQPVDPALQVDPSQDFFQHGVNLYERARASADLDLRVEGFQRAVEVFTRYLDQFPRHPNAEAAKYYLAESYYLAGRPDDGRRSYQALLRDHGNGRYAPLAAYRLAADHFNNRQYALAAPLFEKMAAVAKVPSERQQGLFHAGFSYELQGRTREAMDYYRKVIADPGQPNAFLDRSKLFLGQLLARAEKLDEALPLLDDVVMSRSGADLRGPAAIEAGAIAAKQGDAALSDKYLGLVLSTPGFEKYRPGAQIAMMKARYDRKQHADVIRIFRQSAEKAVGEQEALRLMLAAKSHFALEKNVEALELFREVEKLMLPTNSFAFEANYLRLLCFYRIEGRHVPEQVDAFLQLYQKKRAQDPKVHSALLMKAETLMANKKAEEAAKVYAEIDPALLSPANRKGMLYQRARCQILTEDPQGAIRSFSEFIANFPEDPKVPSALLQRAGAYRDSGEPAKALADYEKLRAAEIDPEFRSLALLESADIAKEQGNLQDMITRFRDFLGLFPEAEVRRKAKANYWLAWGLIKTDQVKDALPHAETARKLDEKTYGKNAGALIALGQWSLQNPEAACEEVDLAIKGGYVENLPDQLINWAASQAFSSNRSEQAARFYELIADFENPRATPTATWRNLGKSLLAAGQAEKALTAIENALETEDQPGWKADGQLDRAKALFALGKLDESMKAVEACQEFRPEGRVNFEVREVKGDILLLRGDAAGAAGEYQVGVQFLADDDRTLKPRLMWKLEKALRQRGDAAEADRVRQKRETDFPGWEAPQK